MERVEVLRCDKNVDLKFTASVYEYPAAPHLRRTRRTKNNVKPLPYKAPEIGMVTVAMELTHFPSW